MSNPTAETKTEGPGYCRMCQQTFTTWPHVCALSSNERVDLLECLAQLAKHIRAGETLDRKNAASVVDDAIAALQVETPASHVDAFLAMALPRIAALMKADPEDATSEGRELMLLAELADRYEKQKYPEFAGRPVRPHSSGNRGPAPELPLPINAVKTGEEP